MSSKFGGAIESKIELFCGGFNRNESFRISFHTLYHFTLVCSDKNSG